ncbi:sigma factor-like helix-turn-helix DNA-binding protein [Streptomyces solincola]|uniref:sigma factor-like helix-turn-helix DNA-binding protein n=1 Tax=Streptomyces solincola TaxID=2100817 RepID=UPI002AFE270B|nr:sigma factor-like helix-turn-helix DNA-binding protein [Streptomyces solincola]
MPAARPPGFEQGVALTGLLAQLASERREVFVLTQLLGLGYAGTAAAVDCPVGTVRSRAARARRDLVALLTDGEPAAVPPDRRPATRAGGGSDRTRRGRVLVPAG